MTNREALRMLETRCRYFATDNLEIEEIYEARDIIKKDLDILEDFVKLFEGEELDGWVEFNFGFTRESEGSIDNYDGFVSLLKRIRNYLEGVRK